MYEEKEHKNLLWVKNAVAYIISIWGILALDLVFWLDFSSYLLSLV